MFESRGSLKIIIRAGRQFLSEKFSSERLTIGRSPSADFQISVKDISRLHLEVFIRDEVIYIKDLDSVNGTFLNKTRIEPQQEYVYKPGDEIELGKKLAFITMELKSEEELEESDRPPQPPALDSSDVAPSATFNKNSEKTITGSNIKPFDFSDESSFIGPSGHTNTNTSTNTHASTHTAATPLTSTSAVLPPAVLEAKKTSEEIVAQAKRASEQLIAEGQKERENLLKQLEEYRQKALKETEQQKAKLLAQAKDEAARILEDEMIHALRKADKKIEEANRKSAALITAAQQERDHLLTNAHTEAQKIFKESEDERHHSLNTLRQDIQRLQSEAEEKAEATYKKANQLLEQAQAHYRESVTKADKESNEILKHAQSEANKLLDSAKEKAQARIEQAANEYERRLKTTTQECEGLKQKAIKETTDLKQKTTKDVDELRQRVLKEVDKIKQDALHESNELKQTVRKETQELRQATLQAAEAKAEEMIVEAQREVRLVYQNNVELKDKIEAKIAGAKHSLTALEEKLKSLQSTSDEKTKEQQSLLKKIVELKTEKENVEHALESLEKKLSSQNQQLEKKLEDKKQLLLELDTLKKEIKDSDEKRNRDAIEIAGLKRQIEEEKNKLGQELQSLRDQALNEVEKFKKKELHRIEEDLNKERKAIAEVRIQADRNLAANRRQLAEGLSLAIKGEVLSSLKSAKESGEAPDLKSLFDEVVIPKIESDIVAFTEVSLEAVQQEIVVKKNAVRHKHLKRTGWAMTLLFVGLIAVPDSRNEMLNWIKQSENSTSAQEFAKQMEGQRSKRFDPPRTADWFPSYVDSVLYSKGYIDQKLSSDVQEKWFREIQDRMFKEQKVPEDIVIKVVSMEAALITQLKEQRESLHPEFIGISLNQMRTAEAETVERMKNLLGEEDKYKAYLEYSKAFYDQQTNVRLPAAEDK